MDVLSKKNKVNIIITGTSRGIGFELAKQFASEPQNNVIALSRNIAPIKEIPAHQNLEYFSFDMLNTEDFFKLKKLVEDFFMGTINIIINNAGYLVNKQIDDITNEDFDRVFDINIKGPFRMIRDLLPYLPAGSHIVNITSMGGFQGSTKFPGLSIYSASKGALGILTECLAEELKPRKISVNALALAAVNTEMLKEAFPGYEAPLSAPLMAGFIKDFALNGHKVFNGKILPVSLSVP
jgi:3-oxoacyl-[acyl-carrier protein] reductase